MKVPEIIMGRQAVRVWRRSLEPGAGLGFVPTMGALHEGHLSLVRAARERDATVAVSIYVNPSQFAKGEDLSSYPRDLEGDAALAGSAGADVVITFDDSDMYPPGFNTWVDVEDLSEGLCGASRPGHFRGVATIVAKLFNIVKPGRAYFGQKDAQQAAVIKRMTSDLDFDVEVKVMPTVREPDGLAMSSRNRYLSPEERRRAVCLRGALLKARAMTRSGERDCARILAAMREEIEDAGGGLARIDYVDIVDPRTFKPVRTVSGGALAVLAVKIGKARLLDNDFLTGD